jgi:release factor glutamine methyltransferase
MKLLDILSTSTEFLEKSGIPDPLAEAEILILHATGVDRLTAYRDNPEISQDLLSKIHNLLDRRSKGEPIQYIVGHVNFLNLKISVGKGILIPRPETELLVQEAIKELRSQMSNVKCQTSSLSTHHSSLTVLDLCTGSGCISLSLAKKFPDSDIYGTDISETAIQYAKLNADINRISNVKFIRGYLFEPIKEALTFDIIVSNPPYIRTSDISRLQREIKDWEPIDALDGGVDGLDFYRKIFAEAGKYMKKKGKIFFEVGFDQALAAIQIAENAGLKNITKIKDFAGIDRILKAEK